VSAVRKQFLDREQPDTWLVQCQETSAWRTIYAYYSATYKWRRACSKSKVCIFINDLQIGTEMRAKTYCILQVKYRNYCLMASVLITLVPSVLIVPDVTFLGYPSNWRRDEAENVNWSSCEAPLTNVVLRRAYTFCTQCV